MEDRIPSRQLPDTTRPPHRKVDLNISTASKEFIRRTTIDDVTPHPCGNVVYCITALLTGLGFRNIDKCQAFRTGSLTGY